MCIKQVPKYYYFICFVFFLITLDKHDAQVKVPLKNRPVQKPTLQCSKYEFACENKIKCVDFIQVCDDIKDCEDGSEEYYCYSYREKDRRCQLPEQTPDKSYALNCKDGVSTKQVKGKYAPEYSTLTFSCHPGYTREEGSNMFKSYCIDGTWSQIPSCKKICKRIFPTNLNLECFRNNKNVDCYGPLLSGTTVKTSCKYQYKLREPINYDEITCDENGQWSNPLPECILECGMAQENTTTIQVIGNPNNYNNFPWHVAIYEIKNGPILICSGTIISPILIITARTCIQNKITFEKLKPRNLQIVVGKSTPNYFIQDNEFQKSFEVFEIYENQDLAILELNEKISFSYAVLSACIGTDYRKDKNEEFYYKFEPKNGTIASWGITNSNNTDENAFRIDEYESRSYEDCTTHKDKFCGQLTNGAGTNISDTGAGFMYKHTDNAYYLIGVMETKYKYKNNYVVICTNLEDNFEKWVDTIFQRTENQQLFEEISKNFRTRTECEYESSFNAGQQKAAVCLKQSLFPIIPPCKKICNRLQPKLHMKLHCTYNNISIDCNSELVEGTKISIQCDDEYIPLNNLNYDHIVCQKNGQWSNEIYSCVASSLKSCALPSPTKDKDYITDCKYDSERTIDVENSFVKELTMLTFQCKPGYFRADGNSFQVICLNGTWTPKIENCIPICKTFQSMNLNPECYYEGERINCNQFLPAGTRMRPLCEKYYRKKYVADYDEQLICAENGDWDAIPIECIQPCGNNIREGSEYYNNYNEIAFQIAIVHKSNKTQVCTGTLITPYLILTAARCFYNTKFKNVNHFSNYEIQTGKRVKPLASSLQSNVLEFTNYRKTYQIQNIYFTNKGRNKIVADYTEDLAVIETVEKIQININTISACLNWHGSAEFDVRPFSENNNGQPGKIAKWGKEFLQQDGTYIGNEISLVTYLHFEYPACLPYLPNGKENKSDLMCMWLTNKEVMTPNDIDYGTGYFQVRGDWDLYHVQGVFSGRTTNSTLILMINVNYHTNWLKRINQWIEKRRMLQETKKMFQIQHYDCMQKAECESVGLTQRFTFQSYVSFCDGKEIRRQFAGGCNLPISSDYDIHYEIQCPFNDFSSNCKSASENSSVPELTKLIYQCKPGYALENNGEIETFCHSKWIPPIMPCKRLCKKLYPINVKLQCSYAGRSINCNGNLVENTIVVPECLQEYEPEYNPGYHELKCLSDGEWSGRLYSCRPKCGRSATRNITELIIGGYQASFGEFPWHVGIYDKTYQNILICGGTIISPYVVISAAHCFFNRTSQKILPPQNYEIAVGKITRSHDIKDSEVTKFYQVENIIMENFLGITLRYQYDIVLLQIKNKIEFNSRVTPICLHHSPTIIPSGEILTVCGWGVDETDTPSPTLRVAKLPFLSVSECSKKAPENIVDYISVDKFCVGNLNGSIVTRGDSGGGLFLPDKTSSLYYLVGIVSFKAVDLPTVALITDVNQHYYLNWISRHMNEIHRIKQYEIASV